MPQNPHIETLATLLPKEYYDRHQIQNDGKYCQHEKDYEVEQQSVEKSDRKGSLRNQSFKRHDHVKIELLKVVG